MNIEQQYLALLRDVLENGDERTDRTGVGTRAVFGRQIRGHLKDGFPLLTTKRVAFGPVYGELLWFLKGSGNELELRDLTYGDRSRETIWTKNAKETTAAKYTPAFEGDLGRIYGVQWRSWRRTNIRSFGEQIVHDSKSSTYLDAKVFQTETDQIAEIVHKLRTNPTDRRMILTAFNVGELDDMMLPPCHMMAQFFVNKKWNELSCQVYIRSNDLGLGLPYNIASYALLTHMLAQVTGFNPGEIIITIGDAHIYNNHIEQLKQQLNRTPFPFPTINLNKDITDIDAFKKTDIVVTNYNSHPALTMPMAA